MTDGVRQDLISVVVPVRNGETTIAACLRSLLACRRPAGLEAEILVVDDGSTDGTAQVVARFPEVRYLHQVASGPSIARNRGIAESHGEAVLFTDDDCEVDEAWLVELVNTLRSTDAAAAGGSQHIHAEDRGLARDVSLFLSAVGFCGGYTKLGDAIREVQHNAACNSAYRREALTAAGGFAEDLWPGEDVELDLRIGKLGGRIIYNPRARVFHRRRGSLLAFARMMARYGCWSGGYLTRHFGPFRPLSWAPALFALLVALAVWRPLVALGLAAVLAVLAIRLFVRAGVPFSGLPRMLLLTLIGGACWNAGFVRGFLVGRPPRPGLVPVASQPS